MWLKHCLKLCKPSKEPWFPLFLIQKQNHSPPPSKTNTNKHPRKNPQASHFDSYPPIMGKTGSHCPSTSRWDLPGALKLAKARTPETSTCCSGQSRWGAKLSWLPKGFWNSSAHLGAMVDWRQWPDKGNVGCMTMQAPDLRNSSPNMALTLETMLSGQFTGNEN